jgi:NitT/TauT family transport system substrate-binding protein
LDGLYGTPHTRRALLVGIVLLALACAPPAAPSPTPAASAPKPAATAQAPAAAAPAPTSAPQPPVKVRIASQLAASDVGHYLAIERGYYQQEGLDVELVSFADASQMIPALATDQVEAGGIGGNPAMWNAVARGVPFKLMLDKGSVRPGASFFALVIRKDVYDAGRGRRLEDLRGLRIAFSPPGKATTIASAVDFGLQRVGSSVDDLAIEPLANPDQIAALANGSVEGAVMLEPFLSRAVTQGSAVRLVGLDELYPDFCVGNVGVSRGFYLNRDAAKGLARAYIRAARDYNNAVAGRTTPADRAQIDEIVSRYTRIDVAAVSTMAPVGINPNGRFNVDSIRYMYRWFREQGFVPEAVSDAAMEDLWGLDLVDEVLAQIGRVPEN